MKKVKSLSKNVELNGRDNSSNQTISVSSDEALTPKHTVSDSIQDDSSSTSTATEETLEQPALSLESHPEELKIDEGTGEGEVQKEVWIKTDEFDLAESGRLRDDDDPDIVNLRR